MRENTSTEWVNKEVDSDTTNFAAIKKHYHIDCCPSNEFAIVPNGPDESLWLTPHGREKLSGK